MEENGFGDIEATDETFTINPRRLDFMPAKVK